MGHIVLDIGHANGTGARGNGQEEHDLCVKVAEQLKVALAKVGHKVTVLDYPNLSNTADLNQTIKAANALKNVDFGISLHMDAFTNPNAKGAHVCHYPSVSSKRIARAIADSLTAYMPGRANKIVARRDLAILKRTTKPWALIELGFITSKVDIEKLMDNPNTSDNELQPLIKALVKGINKASEGN